MQSLDTTTNSIAAQLYDRNMWQISACTAIFISLLFLNTLVHCATIAQDLDDDARLGWAPVVP